MKNYYFFIVLLLEICYQCTASTEREKKSKDTRHQTRMHPPPSIDDKISRSKREDLKFHRSAFESTSGFWRVDAQKKLRQQLGKKPNTNIAKNLIMFLGDGMSISTIAAARIYFGQKMGYSGEESLLSFEEFPHIGLSKVRLQNIHTNIEQTN